MSFLNTTQLYQGYTYGYPHKSAYRIFKERQLKDIWQNQSLNDLFFYVHIPFCEMRCGFCNLFTVANPKGGVMAYLKAVQRELKTYQSNFPEASFAQFAIGGGTPTFLNKDEMTFLFQIINDFGLDLSTIFGSIEASPKTLSKEKINLIEQAGITRLSLGIQSWLDEETKALGRPQEVKQTEATVDLLAASSIPEFNLDLIYGAENQTIESFIYSLEKTIAYQPTEVFLYPLYIRQLTGLGKKAKAASIHREALYMTGRETLLNAGYVQTSMRCFRKESAPDLFPNSNYDSIQSGMIGIGAGARSYTQELHYSSDYAVDRQEIKSIISQYSAQHDFNKINYGFELNLEEQKRRFLIKSLTDGGELATQKYSEMFRSNPFMEFELLAKLDEQGMLWENEGVLGLKSEAMKYEDVIGPALYSEKAKTLMEGFEWK